MAVGVCEKGYSPYDGPEVKILQNRKDSSKKRIGSIEKKVPSAHFRHTHWGHQE